MRADAVKGRSWFLGNQFRHPVFPRVHSNVLLFTFPARTSRNARPPLFFSLSFYAQGVPHQSMRKEIGSEKEISPSRIRAQVFLTGIKSRETGI